RGGGPVATSADGRVGWMPESPDDDGGDDLHDAAAHSMSQPAPAAASRSRPHWLPFLALASGIVAADQLTKAWIVANVDPQRPLLVVGDLVRLVYSRNTGALFGLFRDNATLFALVSIAVIGAIAWYHGRAGRSLLLSVALGLLLGGAVGNLIDRLARGHVVDFVDAGIGDLRWYTFNVADAAISTALVLLIVLTVWPSPAGESRSEPGGPSRGGDPTTDA
ncbi:MAG TPA: signal peptidase II, partial [Vitreimonas sp.]|nr:signal peptidase II [Vitreimonas sp.]